MNYILKNNKKQAWRHGEIIGVLINKLPDGLELSKSKVIMVGSHSNSHTIDKGELYFKKEGDYVFGYLVAKNTTLLHPEHGDKNGRAKIADGIYKLIKQNDSCPRLIWNFLTIKKLKI
jgi:hypothetical protein